MTQTKTIANIVDFLDERCKIANDDVAGFVTYLNDSPTRACRSSHAAIIAAARLDVCADLRSWLDANTPRHYDAALALHDDLVNRMIAYATLRLVSLASDITSQSSNPVTNVHESARVEMFAKFLGWAS